MIILSYPAFVSCAPNDPLELPEEFTVVVLLALEDSFFSELFF